MKDTEQIFIDQLLTTMLVKESMFLQAVIGVESYTSLNHCSQGHALTYHKISRMIYLKKETENTEK